MPGRRAPGRGHTRRRLRCALGLPPFCCSLPTFRICKILAHRSLIRNTDDSTLGHESSHKASADHVHSPRRRDAGSPAGGVAAGERREVLLAMRRRLVHRHRRRCPRLPVHGAIQLRGFAENVTHAGTATWERIKLLAYGASTIDVTLLGQCGSATILSHIC
jgi:hypothetical protein